MKITEQSKGLANAALKPIPNETLIIYVNDDNNASFTKLNLESFQGEIIDLTDCRQTGVSIWAGRVCGLFNAIKNDLIEQGKQQPITTKELRNSIELESLEYNAFDKAFIEVTKELQVALGASNEESITDEIFASPHYKLKEYITSKDDNIALDILNSVFLSWHLSGYYYRHYLMNLPAYGIEKGSELDKRIEDYLDRIQDIIKKSKLNKEFTKDEIKKMLEFKIDYIKAETFKTAKKHHQFIQMQFNYAFDKCVEPPCETNFNEKEGWIGKIKNFINFK